MRNDKRPLPTRRPLNHLARRRGIATVSREEHALVQFALTWLPFGNIANEYLWVEFGMTPSRYVDRLAEALEGPVRRTLHPETLQELKRFVSQQIIDRRRRNHQH
ncbi:hypothetical protein [Rhodococcus wratislaviensis]|uniref:DUF3263 domain-containing protein n=1 Tax=Rhodococcus wratislaviensis NBRC 100605 TaxID=1219028 RepID=X0Q2A1_RHOWR|nr:hypothetical protein [Rhodococcus wratislaviensis]GAF50314.1 hypothetical protein RW1_094_03550 [Rhodococcus wratislaviensis NBRC 100605]